MQVEQPFFLNNGGNNRWVFRAVNKKSLIFCSRAGHATRKSVCILTFTSDFPFVSWGESGAHGAHRMSFFAIITAGLHYPAVVAVGSADWDLGCLFPRAVLGVAVLQAD